MTDQTDNSQILYPLQTQAYARDPRSQYLVQSLQALGREPQRSPGQLGENLLADALFQYALGQPQSQAQALAMAKASGDGGGDPPDAPPPTTS